MRQSWRSVMVVLVVALFAGACSGGDGGGSGGGGAPLGGGGGEDAGTSDDSDSGGGDKKFDGCEVVTAEDAEKVLGEPVTPDEEASADPFSVGSCFWTAENETSFKLLQFSVSDDAKFYGGELFKDDEGFEEVDGLGDEAFFMRLGGVALQVRDGDTVVFLTVTDFNSESPLDPEQLKERLKDLAARVLERL